MDKELSPREQEVADWIMEGISNREIAEKLFVCEKTIKFHITNIFRKYGVRNRPEFFKKAYDIDKTKYFVKRDFDKVAVEVKREEYIRVEKMCGFHSKFGETEVATASFSNSLLGIEGWIEPRSRRP